MRQFTPMKLLIIVALSVVFVVLCCYFRPTIEIAW